MGLMVISIWYLPGPYWIRQPCLVKHRHKRLRANGRESRTRGTGSGAATCCDAIGNYERSALTKLASGRELRLSELSVGRHAIAKLLEKGWIERAGSA
jgi:hypothetical protein